MLCLFNIPTCLWCYTLSVFMLVFCKTLHCNGPPWDPKVYKRTTKSDKKVRSWQKLINFTELTGLWGHLYSVHTQVKSENHERNQRVRSMPCHLNKIHPCVPATTGSWYCWWHNFKNSLAITPSFFWQLCYRVFFSLGLPKTFPSTEKFI